MGGKPTRVIVSEGPGDWAFFRHLQKKRDLPEFDVFQQRQDQTAGVGAFEQMLRAIKSGSKYTEVEKVVVAADCDSNPERSFNTVVQQIQSAGGFAVPVKPREVATGLDVITTSVLMIPWDNEPGSLETLCFEIASRKHRRVSACVEKFVACVVAQGWEPSKLSKLQLRCLIGACCRSDPNTGLQYAWSRSVELIPLNARCKRLTRIVEYLRGLQ